MSHGKLIKFLSSRFNGRAFEPPSIRAMRTVAGLGIGIAVMALVVAVSISRGFEKKYKEALLEFNAHAIVMSNDESADEKKIDDAVKDLSVLAKTPFLYREALALGKGKIQGLVVKGIDPKTILQVNKMNISAFDGKSVEDALFLSQGEIKAIAGNLLAKSFGIHDSSGKIKLLVPDGNLKKRGGSKFVEVSVAGTFESGMYEFDSEFLLMPISSARALFGAKPNATTGYELRLKDPENSDSVVSKIKESLGTRYSVVDWKELNRDLLSAVKLEELVSGVIMGIMVIVAVLNIIAVLVLITIYRYREIALLLALGTPKKVIKNILQRGGIKVVFKGVFAGIVSGVALGFLIDKLHLIPIEAEIYMIGFLPIDISALICGMIALFGFFAGYLASKLSAGALAQVSVSEGLQIAR